MTTIDTIKDILHENLDIDPADITEESTFESLNIDSLDMVELVCELEDRLDIDLGEFDDSEGIKTLEVYLTYDIEVLGGLRCNNTIFKDGYWNEYAFKTLSDVEEIINGYTIESRFNDFYAYEKVWEER